MIFAKIYNWFFDIPFGERGILQIILWWEIRRIPFNISVGIVGLISLISLFIFVDASTIGHSDEDIVEPISILLAPIGINFCYTLGWIVEVIFHQHWKRTEPKLGAWLLRLGTGLTLFFIMLPALIWGVIFTLVKVGFTK